VKEKPQSEQYKAFETLLGRVLSVPKPQLQLRKEKRESTSKNGPSSRASVDSSSRT
jgi:hypothetical protein